MKEFMVIFLGPEADGYEVKKFNNFSDAEKCVEKKSNGRPWLISKTPYMAGVVISN